MDKCIANTTARAFKERCQKNIPVTDLQSVYVDRIYVDVQRGVCFVFLLLGTVWHESALSVSSRAAACRASVTMLFMSLSTLDGSSERSRSHVDSRELG